MNMPSRKRLVWIILIGFLLIFFGAIAFYLAPIFFGQTVVDEQGNVTREFNLFPFGDDDDGGIFDIFDGDDDDNNGEISIPNRDGETRGDLPRLRKVDPGPVSAAYFERGPNNKVASETEANEVRKKGFGENLIRYVELGTGHVYQTSTDNLEVRRISNTTFPKINEAIFVNFDRMLLRYIDEFNVIKTFSAAIVDDFGEISGLPKKLQGTFLDNDITKVTVSDQGKLFYLRPIVNDETTDVIAGIVADAVGGNKRQVFRSALSEWNVDWDRREQVVLLNSTPSYASYSVAYSLDSQSGATAPFVPGRLALHVQANQSMTKAIISMNIEEESKLFLWDKVTNDYTDLNLSGLADKCIWTHDDNFVYCAVPASGAGELQPDLWYQGVNTFEDVLWYIDAESGLVSIIAEPVEYTSERLDMIDLRISNDDRYLYFRNKNDRALWSFDLFDTANNSATGQ